MLSLRLALLEGRQLVDGDPPETLIFDEVDAGIGGQAAVAVGNALADLGHGRQVMVVTHLPQVAACADHHTQVLKSDGNPKAEKPKGAKGPNVGDGGVTVTTAMVLNREQRITELARMLAGDPESQTARDHAAELLARRKH